jgi:PAS domain S-box-containing protein
MGKEKMRQKQNGLDSLDDGVDLEKEIENLKSYMQKQEEMIHRYCSAFAQAIVGIALIDNDGKFVDVNSSLCDMLGYDKKELKKLTVKDVSHPEDLAKDIEKMGKIKEGKSDHYQMEKRYYRKDGSIMWGKLTVSTINPRFISKRYYIGMLEDISEQKSNADLMRMMSGAIQHANDCVSITDMEDTIIYVNQAFCDTFGYQQDELIGKSIALLRPPDFDEQKDAEISEKTREGGWQGEIINMRKDGTKLPIYLSTSLIKDEFGDPIANVGICYDITARKSYESKIKHLSRASLNYFDFPFAEADYELFCRDLLRLTDAKFVCLDIYEPEERYCKTKGVAGDKKALAIFEEAVDIKLLGKRWKINKQLAANLLKSKYICAPFKDVAPDHFSKEQIQKLSEQYKIDQVYLVAISKEDRLLGSFVIVPSSEKVVEFTDEVKLFANLVGTILLRIEAEKKVIERDKRLSQVTNTISDVVTLTNDKLNCEYTTPSVKHLFGYTPRSLLGKSILDFVHPDDIPSLLEKINFAIQEKCMDKAEFRYRHIKGHHIWVEATGNVILSDDDEVVGFLLGCRDIDDRKKHELNIQKHLKRQELLTNISTMLNKHSYFSDRMNHILKLMGKHFDVSRVYIFEDNEDHSKCSNTYEWYKRGIRSQKQRMQNVTFDIMPSGAKLINSEGMIIATDVDKELPRDLVKILKPQRVKSILIIPMYIDHEYFGFVGFDECDEHRKWEKSEIEFLKTIANLISNAYERKKAEDEVKNQKHLLQTIVNNAPIGIWLTEPNGEIKFINKYFEKMLGFDTDKPSITEEEWQRCRNNDEVAMKSDRPVHFEESLTCTDRQKHIFQIIKNRVSKIDKSVLGVIGLAMEITERKQFEDQLQSSLHEKEILLKEVHHRVKNNMQIISSLMKLQADTIEDEQILDVFNQIQNRVRSMALVHEKLYQTEDFSEIDFKDYLSSLTKHLLQSYKTDHSRVSLINRIDNVHLTIDQAIPCGLILNELISNSLKYAFPDKRSGHIIVELKQNKEHKELVVSDDGIGLSEDIKLPQTESLGLKLVYILLDQLKASYTIDRENGTKFLIKF